MEAEVIQKRIKELETLIKNSEVDMRMALNWHQYEVVAGLKELIKQYSAEKENLENMQENNIN